jgi:hypothetical protein
MDTPRTEGRKPCYRKLRNYALQAGDRLIQATEDLLLGRIADEWDFLSDFETEANEYLRLLAELGLPLSVELEFFRDHQIGDANDIESAHIKSFTSLGFPIYHSPESGVGCALGLVCQWFRLFRSFQDDMRSSAMGRTRHTRINCSRGGRPKKPETLRLERQLQAVIAEEAKHLKRNADDAAQVLSALKALRPRDWIRRVNDRFEERYPLTGPGREKIRMQVTRSPSYQDLQKLLPPADEPVASLVTAKRDLGLALENGLHLAR